MVGNIKPLLSPTPSCCFLTDPLISLLNLIKDFESFGSLSNLKINCSKSYGLNITLPLEQVALSKLCLPFTWQHKAITYLGTQLPSDLSDLYNLNFAPLLASIRKDTMLWDKPGPSWFGRATALKMTVLPRLLYLLQTILMRLPPSFFATLRSCFSAFLWKGKNA